LNSDLESRAFSSIVAYLNGSLIVSVVVGWLAQTWAVFLAVPIATGGSGVYGGDIRLTARRR
jgi:hypothetical protein